jgi:hypothetical protein
MQSGCRQRTIEKRSSIHGAFSLLSDKETGMMQGGLLKSALPGLYDNAHRKGGSRTALTMNFHPSF